MPAVTLETIARKLKVSKVTVSLGLRGSTRISAEMRAKIAKVAADLGYTPNPMVSALMVSLRAKSHATAAPNLCYLTAFPTKDGWREIAVFPRYYEGAKRRAAELGYGLELHWMGEAGDSGARMSTILHSRGIPGIVIAPLPVHGMPLGLDWNRFAAVSIGWSFTEVPCHHVANSLFHTINIALNTCQDRGFTRIGFAIPQIVDDKTEHIWLCAYLGFLARNPKLRKLSPLITEKFNEKPFVEWFRKHKPEVIITTHLPIPQWLKRAGFRIPDDVAYVHLDYSSERGTFSGVDQQAEKLGAAAVDLLVEQINQNRRGIPDLPKSVLIEGVWHEGDTCPCPASAPLTQIPPPKY